MKPIIKSATENQLTLFTVDWEELNKDYDISYQQSILLWQLDVLSFNPNEKEELQEYEVRELVFLKKLFFDSGLSKDYVFSMLSLLEKPYDYSFNQIYWDFDTGHWRLFQEYIEKFYYPNLKSHVISNFEDILSDCDPDELQFIKSVIETIETEREE